MNPSRSWSDRFGYILEKSDDVVIGLLFDFEDLRDRESRSLSNLSSVLFRNLAQLCHRLAGEHLNFQPDLKLSLVRPDFAHLRPRITVDHTGIIKARRIGGKRFSARMAQICVACAVLSASASKESPLRTAHTTAS